ncbi:MAG: hypothetical protein HKN00_04210 [Flavobacteriaceae bacterium]|nr:hypothetical protein [Bacteroidia bacterium]MBT8286860.1 hypothetical protein [Bacteroidia bacterium]NNF74365.1 hypothetical protein [Flavobacteriaceae bacterium]NNK72726.1 hypothetical protein [Flavobacteriaceae bacterium]
MISEGQSLYLRIDGENDANTTFIDSLGYQKRHADFQSLSNAIDSTFIRIQRLGYIDCELIETAKINDSTFHSKLNLNRRFDTIYIYYPKNVLSASDLALISDSVESDFFVLPILRLEAALTTLNSILANRGKPFLSLRLSDLKKESGLLIARLEINQTEKRTIDKIIIKGYERFPKSFIRHYLKIKSGTEFNLGAIRKKSEQLNNLPFANQIREPEMLFTADSTTLYFYIEKTRSNSFDGFLGFGTNDETNKLEFDGYLNLNLVNSLNFGESLQLNYKSDENDQQTLNVSARLPYLFRTPLGTEVRLNIFKKDSSFTTVSQSFDLFYQLNPNQKLFVGIEALQSNNLLENTTANIQDLKSNFVNLKYEWLKAQGNSPLFPYSFRLNAGLGIGRRTINTEKVEQQRFNLDVFRIFNLNTKNSIYLRLQSAGILSDDLYDNELLRLGGINSIRGFEENVLIASLHAVLNTEYRYQLNQTIYIHSIFDAGYLENDLTQSREKLFGFGFGFGLITRAGLLKFNYANGKIEGQNFKLANSKIHISLNAVF